MAKKPTLAHVEMLIVRNETRLKRTMSQLDKLRATRKRLLKAPPKVADMLVQEIAEPKVPASTLVAAVKGHIARAAGHVAPMQQAPANPPSGGSVVKVTSHPVANPDNVKRSFESLGPTGASGPQCLGAVGVPAPASDPVRGDGSNLDIPDFLRRQSSPEAEQIKAEQAAVKKAKAAGRIAKMKAKKSGETRKMPVSGKAALDLIRNG
jgi:hypothetical protein